MAAAMIGPDESLVIGQGPPGSGKTTVIAASLSYWQEAGEPVWVITQSNVGVKNIARSIVKRDIDFKLVVSQEFYHEWHEHLYQGAVEDRIILSDALASEDFDERRSFGQAKIILCTLAMLSNPLLHKKGIFRHRPVKYLLVDEASQINTFEFMHLFHMFEHLVKVCMFGDPKQLPPYGKEQAPRMRTIFDFKHLIDRAYFLDTQYRMPEPLGKFISKHMHMSKLKSVHAIKHNSCIRVVDVWKGEETKDDGGSYLNKEEADVVVKLVKDYYQKLKGDFCIITPYDAQRNTIARLLRAAGLPSDMVFNVDSFQGHEAPYVIVSAVRTTKPGFLSFDNRMNVMLTRCQKGMVLVTQRAFIDGGGKSTLLAKLVRHWEVEGGGNGEVWVDAREVLARQANMPGAPGKHRAPTPGATVQQSTPGQSSVAHAVRPVKGKKPKRY